MTQSPTTSSSELPTSMGLTSAPSQSTWMTARSDDESDPTSVAL
mgnify:CR=1 FL=1